jgi:hypothetical protein
VQFYDIDNANRLYSTIIKKSNPIYGAMFKGTYHFNLSSIEDVFSLSLISNKMPGKVLDLLDDMVVKPDGFTLAIIFSACAQLSDDRAKEIGKNFLKICPKIAKTTIFY